MEKITVKLTNPEGLHARPAALFVQAANKYSSDLELEANGKIVNGKSIIGIMSLGAFQGEDITMTAKGHDQKEMLEELKKLLEGGFNTI
ncbi:HPr family phosphocarrier protein [Paratissierella segnis]|jgi:phosphocarrier protein|uniref:Phosphocarrier protein HPr n=1 Tax=Paratissierella segnis TaxID=2763679 RepID=A0A926ESH5_9FIRM|nr:HPr family phosphocarrier protein [Paratissierella segnis]MBC8586637.1 HPr family phosphocarrier protein [Paratissierella segnis]